MADVKDILSKIKKISDTISVKIPSSGQIVNIKQMSIKQQKDLKNLPKNVTLTLVNLQKEINEIIKFNSDTNLDSINIIDRIILILALKSQISETYKNMSTKDILDQSLTKKYEIKSGTIKTKNFIFDYNIPSLKRDNEVNKYILKTYNNQTASVKDEGELELLATSTYNNMIIPELCKFITDLKIINNEEEISTEWTNLSIHQQIQILEEIPYHEIKDIMNYVQSIRKIEEQFMKYSYKNSDGKNIEITIEFNFDFFNI